MNATEPPVAILVRLEDQEAVFEARPPKRPALAWATVSLAATASVLVLALLHRSEAGAVAAVFLACAAAFALAASAVALRAMYRVRFVFALLEVRIEEVRGLDPPRRWTGSLNEIQKFERETGGLRLVWQGGERGPLLLASETQEARFLERFARCGDPKPA